ncbi:MAG: hypothetical protein ACTSQA_01215 [Candidatus Heimdallarchaeaceae archaeon]
MTIKRIILLCDGALCDATLVLNPDWWNMAFSDMLKNEGWTQVTKSSSEQKLDEVTHYCDRCEVIEL